MLLVVQEVLTHGAAAVRSQVLERRGLGGRCGNDDGVIHRSVILESFHDLRHSRLLLTDGDVDADDIFSLLIDDRVDGDRGLSGLAVADDLLAMPAADGDTGLHPLYSVFHLL